MFLKHKNAVTKKAFMGLHFTKCNFIFSAEMYNVT